MFLWRLGCNVLPIRDNLSRHLAISETCCVLCNRETKTTLHLFFNCPFEKALSFTTCWGFNVNSCNLSSTESIINLILTPHDIPCCIDDLWAVSLNMAFTLEEIWATRNNAIFNKASIDLHHSVTHIHHKLKEALLTLSELPSPNPTPFTQPFPLS